MRPHTSRVKSISKVNEPLSSIPPSLFQLDNTNKTACTRNHLSKVQS
jgi:hypothetical protein